MKIFSNKKYEELVQKLTDLGLEIEYQKSQNEILDRQVKVLLEAIDEEKFTTAKLESDLIDAKKETKRLKTLLTKNKIEYKKEK